MKREQLNIRVDEHTIKVLKETASVLKMTTSTYVRLILESVCRNIEVTKDESNNN